MISEKSENREMFQFEKCADSTGVALEQSGSSGGLGDSATNKKKYFVHTRALLVTLCQEIEKHCWQRLNIPGRDNQIQKWQAMSVSRQSLRDTCWELLPIPSNIRLASTEL